MRELLARLLNGQRTVLGIVEALYEEVPKEAWPRIASRLEAVGLQPPMSDQPAKR